MLRLSIKDCRKYFTVIKISVWNDDVVVCFLKVLTLFRLGFLRVAQLGGRGGGGECPRPITLKLLMVMK